ncbi:hypothetical protein [Cellvibrio sp. OA-2007]|uniref:hypothetical protein n=1 Tax=Cellvibrio sp. OA-2007 TaxID=529823 RepID=UPI000A81B977|nr:hypothetical protein [Cellvibrio sp. OA-2007]
MTDVLIETTNPPKNAEDLVIASAIWIAILMFIVSMGFYLYNFWGPNLSPDTAEWGQFGDYLGGIINPIVGLITITLLTVSLRQTRRELNLIIEQNTTSQKIQKNAEAIMKAQISAIRSEKDLASVQILLKRYKSRLENAPADSEAQTEYSHIVDYLESYIDSELEAVVFNSQEDEKRSSITAWTWQSRCERWEENEIHTHVNLEKNYVEFQVCGASELKGFWREYKRDLGAGDYDPPKTYLVERYRWMHARARRDVYNSMTPNHKSKNAQLKQHPNIFLSLDDLENASP